MLQTNPNFTRIFDDMRILRWHCVDKRLDRRERGDFIVGIHDCKRGNGQAKGTDEHFADLHGSSTKAVFAIEPLDDLVDQLAGKSDLVESPSLAPGMDVKRVMVGDAEVNNQPPPIGKLIFRSLTDQRRLRVEAAGYV